MDLIRINEIYQQIEALHHEVFNALKNGEPTPGIDILDYPLDDFSNTIKSFLEEGSI